MKILFVVPKTKSMFGDDDAMPDHPHVGIAYLSAVTKKEGHEVKIYDQGIEKNDKKLFKLIKSFKPDIIGTSAFSYCFIYAIEVINLIKNKTKIPILIGGSHVSAVKKQVLLDTEADFAMKGEGEVSFVNFLNEHSKKNPKFKRVNGLIWRDNSNKIVENKNQNLIEKLDSLPFPDYENSDIKKYACYSKKTLPIITSRGCPYGCNYCSVRISMGRYFRARSPKNVVDEIEYWYKKGFTNFEINDDCFSLDINRAKKICERIIKKKMNIRWQLYNGIRVDRVTIELMKLMKKSGCMFVSYGCESGDQKIIDNIGKKIKLEQVHKAVDITNKVGIDNSVNFIIGHPGETYETAMNTIKFAKSLHCDFVNFYNLVPYPGTELFEWVKKNAQIVIPENEYLKNNSYRDMTPVFETQRFSKIERIKALKKGFALYERTALKYRFGKKQGYILYILSRSNQLNKLGRFILFKSAIGKMIHTFYINKKYNCR